MKRSAKTFDGAQEKLLRAQLKTLKQKLARISGNTPADDGSKATIQDDIDDIKQKLRSVAVRAENCDRAHNRSNLESNMKKVRLLNKSDLRRMVVSEVRKLCKENSAMQSADDLAAMMVEAAVSVFRDENGYDPNMDTALEAGEWDEETGRAEWDANLVDAMEELQSNLEAAMEPIVRRILNNLVTGEYS